MHPYKEYKSKFKGEILSNTKLCEGIFSVVVKVPKNVYAAPGQFFLIYPKDTSHILGRPISICDFDPDKHSLRFVYQVKGAGTTELSNLKTGEEISLLGALGNGFPLERADSHSLLIGGGMGIAPMLFMAKKLKSKAIAILGYRDEPFMAEDFVEAGCKVIIATESGFSGIRGTVVDALEKEHINKITAYTCGPLPMIKAVCKYAGEHDIDTYVSLEERMGCGIGVCLGCVTPAASANDHYRVKKLCICKDGPVFHSPEVIL